MIELLWPAALLSVVLVMIHAWFGLEVIRRGVVFSDLAVGQAAALGVAFGLVLFEGRFSFTFALVFALVAAALIALASRKSAWPEASIGLIYAFCASMILVVLSRHTEGTEVFKRLLASDLLFTAPDDVFAAAALYAGLALLLWRFYARSAGLKRELWFYGLFAVTVTSSVQLAGVLTVFALLIAPALIALTRRRFPPLSTAWIAGSVLCLSALLIAYYADTPAGHTLTALLSLTALIAALSAPKRA